MKVVLCIVAVAGIAAPAVAQLTGFQASQTAAASRAAASIQTFNENVRGVYAANSAGFEVDQRVAQRQQKLAAYRAALAKKRAAVSSAD